MSATNPEAPLKKELPAIVYAGDPVLRQHAALVRRDQLDTPELRSLVETMTAVMRAAPGVGLAAPQIGVPLQVIVLEDTEALMAGLSVEERAERERAPFPLRVFINPELLPVTGAQATFFEGCLSVPGYTSLVERWREVEVSGWDLEGSEVRWRVRGWPARILQHEVDHVNGYLYVDRMVTRAFAHLSEAQRRWAHASIKSAKEAFGIVEGPPKGF